MPKSISVGKYEIVVMNKTVDITSNGYYSPILEIPYTDNKRLEITVGEDLQQGIVAMLVAIAAFALVSLTTFSFWAVFPVTLFIMATTTTGVLVLSFYWGDTTIRLPLKKALDKAIRYCESQQQNEEYVNMLSEEYSRIRQIEGEIEKEYS